MRACTESARAHSATSPRLWRPRFTKPNPSLWDLEIFQTELLVTRLTRHVYADGGQIKMCAISALEIACWDAIGKALGQPVYNLVGGLCRDRIRAYANGWYRNERTPEAFAASAKKVVARGYSAMKFDPFGTAMGVMTPRDEALSIDIVAAVREAVGPNVDLAIECHSRFNPSTAIRIGKKVERYEPAWFETRSASKHSGNSRSGPPPRDSRGNRREYVIEAAGGGAWLITLSTC